MNVALKRALLPWAAALGVVLAVAFGRAWYEARDELSQAQAAERAGDLKAALAHYQYAARWYTPFAQAPEAGVDALARIAAEAEARGDRETALSAARRARGAILATRGVFSPFGDRLPAVNARLARLTATEQRALGLDEGREPAALEAWHAELLALDPTPSAGWALATSMGFLGWIAGALGLLFRGLDAQLRLVRPAAARWSLMFATCFGIWLLGLWLA